MACARCDFYLPKPSSEAQLLEAKDGLQRMLVQIPLTDEERAAVEGDQDAVDRLLDATGRHAPTTPAEPRPPKLSREREHDYHRSFATRSSCGELLMPQTLRWSMLVGVRSQIALLSDQNVIGFYEPIVELDNGNPAHLAGRARCRRRTGAMHHHCVHNAKLGLTRALKHAATAAHQFSPDETVGTRMPATLNQPAAGTHPGPLAWPGSGGLPSPGSPTVGRTASRSTSVSLPLARGLGSASGRRPAFRAMSTTGSPQGGNQR